jgi:hypothetical protein
MIGMGLVAAAWRNQQPQAFSAWTETGALMAGAAAVLQ